mmetsp:Transcript_14914/g.29435  ORF Transcript_14914/g.29435 Transcript_14914/m.29435 type:complete len:383 (+) Transcript_14914:133-1281(+)
MASKAEPRPLQAFQLERFFADYEFVAPHLMCCSDVEPLSMSEVVSSSDLDTKAMWENLSLAYTESQGLPALREAVSSLYTEASPNDIVVLAPEEGIYLTMRALLTYGDRVVVQGPGYQSLYEVAMSIGCVVDFWHPDGDALTYDVGELESLIRKQKTKLVVINFPHNPTGAMLTATDLKRVVSACSEANSHLFSDEMYRGLEFDQSAIVPSAVDLYDKAVVLYGMSKSFAMPGLRIGWIALRDAALRGRVQELKDYTTICCSAPSEVLALMGLRNAKSVLERNRGICLGNLQLLRELVGRHGDKFSWVEPRGGSMALLRLSDLFLKGGTSRDYCVRLVKSKGILILPSSEFGYGDKHIRLGLGRVDFASNLVLWEASLSDAV